MSPVIDFWTEKMIEIEPEWSWPKWCLEVYEQDLIQYPVSYDRNILALKETLQDDDYLKYFKASRGFTRPLGPYPIIWNLMKQGNAVLYYPEYFLQIINQTKPYQEDYDLLLYLEALCHTPTHQWMNGSSNSHSNSNSNSNGNGSGTNGINTNYGAKTNGTSEINRMNRMSGMSGMSGMSRMNIMSVNNQMGE